MELKSWLEALTRDGMLGGDELVGLGQIGMGLGHLPGCAVFKNMEEKILVVYLSSNHL